MFRFPMIVRNAEGGAGAAGGGDAAAAAAAAASAAAAGAAQTPWYETIDDPEIKTWAAGKNFPDIKTALDSHRNLEKLLGSDKIAMPKGDDDQEGWGRVYRAIGRPDSPEGYKIAMPDGVEGDPAVLNGFAKAAHEAGVSQKGAQKIVDWYNSAQTEQQAAAQAELDKASERGMNELRADWGKDYDANVEAGARAARQFGLGEETLTKIENAIGSKEMLSLLNRIGVGLGEDQAVGLSGGRAAFGMSKSQAQAKLGEVQANPGYRSADAPNHKALVDEAVRLNKIILGQA